MRAPVGWSREIVDVRGVRSNAGMLAQPDQDPDQLTEAGLFVRFAGILPASERAVCSVQESRGIK
jgi:hypothetical protein